MVAPQIAGIASIKENFAASTFLIPSKSAMDIVIPDREIPGKIASAWKIPIINPLDIFNFLVL